MPSVTDEGSTKYTVKDSGKREVYATGAQRDASEGKPRPSLIHPHFTERLAMHMARGADKYDDWNWTKGISTARSLDSLERHIIAIKKGMEDEDHLAAIAANTMFIMCTREMIRLGLLPPELDDMKVEVAKPRRKPLDVHIEGEFLKYNEDDWREDR